MPAPNTSLVVSKPAAWKLVHPSGIRRIGLMRFSYTVFYRVLPDKRPQVTAFAHHRRRPRCKGRQPIRD